MVREYSERMAEEIVPPLADGRCDRVEFPDESRKPLEPRAKELAKESYRVSSLRKYNAHCDPESVGLQAKHDSEIR